MNVFSEFYLGWNPQVLSLHTVHPRFLNYHGQYGARLNRDQSVHNHGPKPRSFLIKTLAPALYNAPYVHLQALEKTWIDETMCLQPWEQLIEKLRGEWQEFVLYVCVISQTPSR